MNRCSLLLCSKGRGALGSTSARRSVLAGSRGGRGGKTGGFERWGPGCDGCEQERSPRRLVPVDPTTSRTGTRQASGTCTLRLDVFGSREGEGERDRGLGIVLLSPPLRSRIPCPSRSPSVLQVPILGNQGEGEEGYEHAPDHPTSSRIRSSASRAPPSPFRNGIGCVHPATHPHSRKNRSLPFLSPPFLSDRHRNPHPSPTPFERGMEMVKEKDHGMDVPRWRCHGHSPRRKTPHPIHPRRRETEGSCDTLSPRFLSVPSHGLTEGHPTNERMEYEWRGGWKKGAFPSGKDGEEEDRESEHTHEKTGTGSFRIGRSGPSLLRCTRSDAPGVHASGCGA